MKLFYILFFPLFFVSCWKPTPNINIPNAPVKTEDPTPYLDKVRENVEEISNKNKEISTNVKKATESILKQKASIEEALAQSEKIKERALAKQTMTELEALNLEIILKKIADENQILKTDNEDLILKVEDLSIIINKTEQSEKQIREKLVKSQDELKEFRIKFDQISKDLKTSEKSRLDTEEQLRKAQKEAADAKVYKKIIWFIAIGFFLLLLIKANLSNTFPGLKR
jgi:chromosome segregation ATPase